MQTSRRRVLCAEPHADTCSLLNHLLEQSNYEVLSAKNVADALTLARGQPFDLYLLSDRYDDGTALDLCRQLRQFDSHTPILFYSTYARESDRRSGVDAGAQGYLVKPGDVFELADTVSRLIQQTEHARAENSDLPDNAAPGGADRKLETDSERRGSQRVRHSLPLVVYGVDAVGEEFESETVLGDLSSGGFYLQLPRHVERGAKLSLVVRLSTTEPSNAPARRVAVNGRVARTEPRSDGVWGLGIELHNVDFLDAWAWALR
ncbi:MAG TPA: response regulator [Pyrinomonadaceae bacterium]|jgi:CheY-like chemotaxis protein|nr:response regulator [Pyrinomonadaceae bacterium]